MNNGLLDYAGIGASATTAALRTTEYTSGTGTHYFLTATKTVVVTLVGGGGSGGGGNSAAFAGGGGGGGEYIRAALRMAPGTTSAAYAVGAGAPASGAASAGSNGGVTRFGTLVASPGLGGVRGSTAAVLGGEGGGGTSSYSGTFIEYHRASIAGGRGGPSGASAHAPGWPATGTTSNSVLATAQAASQNGGGDSVLGAGGAGGSGAAGSNGSGYGGGGGGGGSGAPGYGGGAGANGYILVEEYAI